MSFAFYNGLPLAMINGVPYILGAQNESVALMPGPNGFNVGSTPTQDTNMAFPFHLLQADGFHSDQSLQQPDCAGGATGKIVNRFQGSSFQSCSAPSSDGHATTTGAIKPVTLIVFVNNLAALIVKEEQKRPAYDRAGFHSLKTEAERLQVDAMMGCDFQKTKDAALRLHARLYLLIKKQEPAVQIEQPQQQAPVVVKKKKPHSKRRTDTASGPKAPRVLKRKPGQGRGTPVRPEPVAKAAKPVKVREPGIRSRELYDATQFMGMGLDWLAYYEKIKQHEDTCFVDPVKGPDGKTRNYGCTRSGNPRFLRPYQTEANMNTQARFAEGYDRGLLILPPRTGKTITAASTAKNLSEAYPKTIGKEKIILVGHTNTIVTQNYNALKEVFGDDEVGIVGAGKLDLDKRVISLSIQTWFTLSLAERKRLGLAGAGIIILDEAHYYTYGNENLGLLIEAGFISNSGKLQYQAGRLLLGMTGTPERNTKAPLRAVYGPEGFWFERDISYYENNHFLLKYRKHSPELTGIDFDNLEIDEETGDFKTEGLVNRLSSEALANVLAGLIKQELVTDAAGRYKKTIVFVNGIEDTQEVAANLRQRKIRAAPVHSKMTLDELKLIRSELVLLGANIPLFDGMTDVEEAVQALLEASRAGEIDILINDRMLMHGYDDPEIEVVILGRAIGSRSLFVQMLLRGATLSEKNPDKEFYDAYDLGQNFERFSVPLSYHVIYQVEEHGQKRFVLVNKNPSEIAKKDAKKRPAKPEIDEAVLRYHKESEAVVRNLYRPFQEAYQKLLLNLVDDQNDDNDEKRIEKALEILARKASSLTGHRGFLNTHLSGYAQGLAIPDYTELDLLMAALGDKKEELLVAWSQVMCGIETLNHPVEVITEKTRIQNSWEQFIHEVRLALFRYHAGVFSRVCQQTNQFLLKNLFYGKFPDEDEWRHLIPILEKLFMLENPEAKKRHMDIVDYLSQYADRLHSTISHYYVSAKGGAETESLSTHWKLKDFSVKDPVTGKTITLGVWRALNTKRTAVAFVDHSDWEVVRTINKDGRGLILALYDSRSGLYYKVKKAVNRNRYYLKRIKQKDVVALLDTQREVIQRLPDVVRDVYQLAQQAFSYYAPSPQYAKGKRVYPAYALQLKKFLRGEAPDYISTLFAYHEMSKANITPSFRSEVLTWSFYDALMQELKATLAERDKHEKGSPNYNKLDKQLRELRRELALLPNQPLRILNQAGLVSLSGIESESGTNDQAGFSFMERSLRAYLMGSDTEDLMAMSFADSNLSQTRLDNRYSQEIKTWLSIRELCIEQIGKPYFLYDLDDINNIFNRLLMVLAPELVQADDYEVFTEITANSYLESAQGRDLQRGRDINRVVHGVLDSITGDDTSFDLTRIRARRILEREHGINDPHMEPMSVADMLRRDEEIYQELRDDSPRLQQERIQGRLFNDDGVLSRERPGQIKRLGYRLAGKAVLTRGVSRTILSAELPFVEHTALLTHDSSDRFSEDAFETMPSDTILDNYDDERAHYLIARERLVGLQEACQDRVDLSDIDYLLEDNLESPLPEFEESQIGSARELMNLLLAWGKKSFVKTHHKNVKTLSIEDYIIINAAMICGYGEDEVLLIISKLCEDSVNLDV